MMGYKEIKPHPGLVDYIDAFWTVTNNSAVPVSGKILPDGCVDMILNLGKDCQVDNSRLPLQHGEACLVGTMRHFKTTELHPETCLLGIRFKPSAFPSFYRFASLYEVTDMTVPFEKKLSPVHDRIIADGHEYLNQFFIEKLSTRPVSILTPIIEDIKRHKGIISVTELAGRHYCTARQLERHFRQHIGISPKEFINLTRFQFVKAAIEQKPSHKSMLEVAFEYGYYDHAHLANSIKSYTGSTPTQL